jgi:hypothetical protein
MLHVSRPLAIAVSSAALLLAGGGAAYASQAGGTPSPSSDYGQHQEQPQCQIITLQGFGAQTGHKDRGGDQGGYGTQAPANGGNYGDHGQGKDEVVVVTQQVQFCEQGERTWTSPVPGSLRTVEGVVEQAKY